MDEEKRSNQNYEIIESCTIGSTELVIGHNPNAPNPYVCWYVGKCKELALYDTGVTAEYGDRLITLSTCEYSAQNGRLVVVAKKVG